MFNRDEDDNIMNMYPGSSFLNYVVRHAMIILVAAGLTLAGCRSKNELKPGEGFAQVTGGKIWYRVVGKGDKTPIILLHGGPGVPSYYLNPLAALGKDRPVIFLDQFGCGRSDGNKDTTLMTVDTFVEQLDQLRTTLGIEKFYLYGSSWGTMLGVDYYLAHPDAVKAMILSSPCLSAKMWTQDADTLISTLPDSVQQVIRESEERNDFSSPAYQAASSLYSKSFVVRTSSPDLDSTMSGINADVYTYMWGPSEFTATGTLKNYDRTSDLPSVKVPTLFLAGKFDEARPTTVKYYSSLVPGSRFEMLKDAGHITMQEHPEQDIKAITDFLQSIE